MNGTHRPPPSVTTTPASQDVESAVLDRYREVARSPEPSLCSPTRYDPRYLEIIPEEILERDYGCGDPSRFVRSGETVLDLGSGSGKIGYILAQMVGPGGRIIGVDFNDAMLSLSRKHLDELASRLGYRNVEFRKGRIQDLALDCDRVDAYLSANPVRSSEDLIRLRQFEEDLRQNSPLVRDASVDLVVSNCVLNLVRPEDRVSLFREMHRVLRGGGRAAISDIVSDEEVPEAMRADPKLWSGCVSGAFKEDGLLRAFEEAGFHGLAIESWAPEPYRTVEGIEFRSVTVTAHKGEAAPCLERNQAVIYRGPWKSVTDDDHHTLPRGVRVAVCDMTYRRFASGPYQADLIFVDPRVDVPLESAAPFDCARTAPRDPRETKGREYRLTAGEGSSRCDPSSGCC